VARLQQQIERCLVFHTRFVQLGHPSMENDLCTCRKHWLEYDGAAIAFLIVGMAAVGLLVLRPSWPPLSGYEQQAVNRN
jgi:hypothetical protein